MAQPRSRNSSGPIAGWWNRRRLDQEEDLRGWRTWQEGQGQDGVGRGGGTHALDYDVALARLLKQIDRSTSPVPMQRFVVEHPAYSQLIWQMRKSGWDLRARALQYLARTASTPDPLAAAPASTRRVLEAAWHQLGLPRPWIISAENGLTALRDQWSEMIGMRVYAWVHTFPGGERPCLVYDFAGDYASGRFAWNVEGQWQHPRMATLHAAMCLGALYAEWTYYLSRENPGDVILPPNPARFNRSAAVPLHSFMRALLNLGDDCPRTFGCECNNSNWQIREGMYASAAQGHDNTDLLPPYPYDPQHQQPPAHVQAIRSAPLVSPFSAASGGSPRTTGPVNQSHNRSGPIARRLAASQQPQSDDASEDGVPDETEPAGQDTGGWGREL